MRDEPKRKRRKRLVGAANPNNPRRIKAAARDAEAVTLRAQGRSYTQIAEMLGYPSRGAAFDGVERSITRARRESAEALQAVEMRSCEEQESNLADLRDQALKLTRSRAHSTKLAAIARLDELEKTKLQVKARRARYVPGLEVPTRQAVEMEHQGGITVSGATPRLLAAIRNDPAAHAAARALALALETAGAVEPPKEHEES